MDNIYHQLAEISQRPEPFSVCTVRELWNDPHVSASMLKLHLDEQTELASRNGAFIDRSADWIARTFGLREGARVCDFGCGPGLYTSRFATMGARVTGIDFSERSIAFARDFARARKLDIDYHLQNYLELELAGEPEFDLITLIYCDFCPLSTAQQKQLLAVFRKYLAKDGKVLLDVHSAAAYRGRTEAAVFAHRLMDGFWAPGDYYGFLQTFLYDDRNLVLDKYDIIEPHQHRIIYNWLQYFTADHLRQVFEENGFKVEALYANVAGDPLQDDSPEIAIIAAPA